MIVFNSYKNVNQRPIYMAIITRSIFIATLICLICQLLSVSANATNYILTDLGTLGGLRSYAYSINNRGQVVGSSNTENDSLQTAMIYNNGLMMPISDRNSLAKHINDDGTIVGTSSNQAFKYKDGTVTFLGTMGGIQSEASSINNKGDIIGWHQGLYGSYLRSYMIDAVGSVADLPTLAGATYAYDINDYGQIVGSSEIYPITYGYLIDKGVIYNITPSDWYYSIANAINNQGYIVGIGGFPAGSHAFLYKDGVMHDLHSPKFISSQAYSINDDNNVVGVCETVNGNHACITVDGVFDDLNSMVSNLGDWVLNEARGINDLGQIAGIGTINGQSHGYLLTPDVIEPIGTLVINDNSKSTKSTALNIKLYAHSMYGSISNVRFSNDGSNWSSWEYYTDNKTWIVSNDDGVKSVYVQYMDSEGNVSATKTKSIILDTTPPIVTITNIPTSPSLLTGNISFTANETNSAFKCSLDAGPYEDCNSPYLYTFSNRGEHQFNVIAIDAVGNESNVPASANWVASEPNVKLNGNYYYTINAAIGFAPQQSAFTVYIPVDTYAEDIIITDDKNVSIIGGYNDTCGCNTGMTELDGSIVIVNGSLLVDNVIIK